MSYDYEQYRSYPVNIENNILFYYFNDITIAAYANYNRYLESQKLKFLRREKTINEIYFYDSVAMQSGYDFIGQGTFKANGINDIVNFPTYPILNPHLITLEDFLKKKDSYDYLGEHIPGAGLDFPNRENYFRWDSLHSEIPLTSLFSYVGGPQELLAKYPDYYCLYYSDSDRYIDIYQCNEDYSVRELYNDSVTGMQFGTPRYSIDDSDDPTYLMTLLQFISNLSRFVLNTYCWNYYLTKNPLGLVGIFLGKKPLEEYNGNLTTSKQYMIIGPKSAFDTFFNSLQIPFTYDSATAQDPTVKPEDFPDYNPDYIPDLPPIEPDEDRPFDDYPVSKPTENGGYEHIPISAPSKDNQNYDDTTSDVVVDNDNLNGILGNTETNLDFFTVYHMTDAELWAFAGYCWSENIWNVIDKWFTNPTESVLSLKRIPYTPSSYSGETTDVYIGTVKVGPPTSVVAKQFETLDMGTVNITEYYGSFLDYEPYTFIQLYLPYVGFVSLKTADVMNSQLNVKYYIDNVTTSFQAVVTVIKDGHTRTPYYYNGTLGFDIPLTENSFSDTIKAMIQSGVQIATATSSIALSTFPVIDSYKANTMPAKLREIQNLPSGPNLVSDAKAIMDRQGATKSDIVNHLGNEIISKSGTINNAISALGANVMRTGTPSPNTDVFCYKKPYITITRVNASIPQNFRQMYGIPSNIYAQLSTLKGFTKLSSIRLTNIPCTADELELLYQQLTTGVIL